MREKVNAVHQLEFQTELYVSKESEYAKKIPGTCRIFYAAASVLESSFHVLL
jgi:hypothetical protein